MESSRRDELARRGREALAESVRVKERFAPAGVPLLVDMAEVVLDAFRRGGRLFLFGNGGSAADAQHVAAEFVNRFRRDRSPLPAIALTTDTSILTSIANDFRFADVFTRQLRALSARGDAALGISTSGTSPNVLGALKWARENGLHTLGWTGALQTDMDVYCDLTLHVPSEVTPRIQECHMVAGHILCELVEERLLEEGSIP